MAYKNIKFNTDLNSFNFSSIFKKPVRNMDIVYSNTTPVRKKILSKIMNIPSIDTKSRNMSLKVNLNRSGSNIDKI